MMPIFFFLFVGLGIYIAFQPGAATGYHYIFRIDPVALADPKTWIFALGQAFFSLSVAGNGTLIYGSYLPDHENIPAAAGRVAFFDTLAAMLAALVIIPAMATTGAKLNQGGPGLLFQPRASIRCHNALNGVSLLIPVPPASSCTDASERLRNFPSTDSHN